MIQFVRTSLVAVCLVAGGGFCALAQDAEPAEKEEKTYEPLEVVEPQREVTFEVAETAVESDVRQFPGSPVQVTASFRYVAVVVTPHGTAMQIHEKVGGELTLGQIIQAMQMAAPPEKRVSDDDLKTLITLAKERRLANGSVHFARVELEMPSTPGFFVMAPTQERAKELSVAYLQLNDYGLILPEQKELVRQYDSLLKDLNEARATYEAARRDAAKKEDLMRQNLFDDTAVTDLRIRSYTAQVDIAGTRARVAAINERLAQKNGLNERRRDQLEELKIDAEVELAGLVARMETLEDLIHRGEQFKALTREAAGASGTASQAFAQVRNIESKLDITKRSYERVQPSKCRVILFPINWDGA